MCLGETLLKKPIPVMFTYWGRKGLTQLTYEVARAALANRDIAATISISKQNENVSRFDEFGSAVFPIDTFPNSWNALKQSWRLPFLPKRLMTHIKEHETRVVVELMPHIWSPFLFSSLRSAGIFYITIVHDAQVHPGDYRTAIAKRVLDRAMVKADLVITMSETVSNQLKASGQVPANKLVTLFHPDLGYGTNNVRRTPRQGQPFRLLWMGRILPYKGLSLFVDAVEILRARGCAVELGVFGEGALGEDAKRLSALGAEVINRWLTEAEIAEVLPRYDAIILSHIEASQSGVAATALGAGLPSVATPVGGLKEQIRHGETGLLARRIDAESLAEAIQNLIDNPALYEAMCRNIEKNSSQRSVSHFVGSCLSAAERFSNGFQDQ
jgi:glycosyltransferase involved in cell wall biosynthesis